ncbi:MAG: hypothetical protein ACE5J2_05530, partial [Nitrososphaerales archaeon]
FEPRIAVSGNNIYLVWQDNFAANDEIFFSETTWITIDSLSNAMPSWDLDIVTLSGRTNGDDTDTISVYWGDGTSTAGISHSGGSWGPVSHKYGSSDVGPNEIVARLLDTFGDEKSSSIPSLLDVRKHATSLDTPTLSAVSVIAGEEFSIIANTLIDAETGMGIEGKTITYSGTAALKNVNGTTVAGGSLSAAVTLTAVGADNVGAGKTVTANFAGDAFYEASSSPPATIEIYISEEVPSIQEKVTVTYQESSFDVMTSLSNGSVKSIEVVPDFTSIILMLETSVSDGELMITLPRALIDSRANGADHDFTILVNGKETDYEEHSATTSERALTVPVFAGAEEVEIFGTQVVPEFPIAVIAVMGAMIATAIAVSRFKNLWRT